MSKDYVHRGKKDQDDGWRKKTNYRLFIKIFSFILLLCFIIFSLARCHTKHKKPNTNEIEIKVLPSQSNKLVNNNEKINKNITEETEKEEKRDLKDPDDPLNAKVNYTFYKTLPNMTSVNLAEQDSEQSNNTANQQYLLQLASFNDNLHAQNLINKLKKLNFTATVTTFPRGDNTIYRVQMGPYKNIVVAREKQDDLQIADIPSLLLVIK